MSTGETGIRAVGASGGDDEGESLNDAEKRLIRDYLDERFSLFDLCEAHGVRLGVLRDFLGRAEVVEAIGVLESLSSARSGRLARVSADRGTREMVALVDEPGTPAETKRRLVKALEEAGRAAPRVEERVEVVRVEVESEEVAAERARVRRVRVERCVRERMVWGCPTLDHVFPVGGTGH